MPDPDPSSLHEDSLSGESRTKRRNLIVASAFGFLVSQVGLVPTRVTFLGLEFSALSRNSFVVLVGATIVYFLAGFLIYGVSDFFTWRQRLRAYSENVEMRAKNWTQEEQRDFEELYLHIPRDAWIERWAKPLGVTRIIFDFALPVLIGGTSLFCLCG